MECLQAHTSGPYLWWEGRDNYYGRYVCCVPAWCLVCPGMDQDQSSVGITCYLLLSPAQAVTLVTLQGYNQYRQSLVIQSDHILILLELFKYHNRRHVNTIL